MAVQAIEQVLQRAREAVAKVAPEPVEKTIWGSPAGKKHLAKRLVAMLPAHKTYVEPFAGSAAVLFEKEPAEVEVINDRDPEIADAYRLVKKLTADDIARLRKMKWVGDKAHFKKLLDESPSDDVARLYRFLYTTHFSYARLRTGSFSPASEGVEAKTCDRIEEFAPRLKTVKVFNGSYETVVRKFDSKDTVYYLDPPYPGYDANVGESEFDETLYLSVLKGLKGKFLCTYGIRGELPKRFEAEGFIVKRIRPPRSIRAMRGVGGPKVLTTLLVTNYQPVEKALTDLAADGWEVLDGAGDEQDVEKGQPFGTFGGSFHYAKRIVPLIPEHHTYVEPFAGAAAVLHAKEPSAKEVIADLDPDVVFLHRTIKAMDEATVGKLRRFDWKVTKASFERARDLSPRDDLERFYKLVFVRTHARDCRPDGTHPAQQHLGSTTDPAKYLKASERLQKVSVLQQDYRKTIEQHDAPDTFFFIDPPYPAEWFDKDAVIDLDDFTAVLKAIQGKFIAVLNDSAENVRAFKSVGHVFRLKVREASGLGGAKKASRLFCANYRIAKSDAVEEVGDAFATSSRLIKGLDPSDERFVLGIVLEPEVVDAQGDIYSPEEIRSAAHRFMEDFGGLGLMHRLRVNDQVKVVECYIAPSDCQVGDVAIRKGTWLLGVHVLSDELWAQVKDGALTGFSIGGSARRVPDAPAAGGAA